MRLKEAIADAFYHKRRPIIPFFPFLQGNEGKALSFLIQLAEKYPPTALGLVYPGRQVFRSQPVVKRPPETCVEWELFQFVYTLKAQTGLPVVLAIHYRDIMAFGVIPYSQEGHKIGLDALLVKDCVFEELDIFSSELAVGGVGLSSIIDDQMTKEQALCLWRYATAFVYLPGSVGNRGAFSERPESNRIIFVKADGNRIMNFESPETTESTGGILESVAGQGRGDFTWSNAELEELIHRIRRHMRAPEADNSCRP